MGEDGESIKDLERERASRGYRESIERERENDGMEDGNSNILIVKDIWDR